ncbi:ABC transporter substrate-binding protein [Paenibacillus arenilitoris]|uniref:Extracellular solute-binding protein n=1 Tax=Paenibacillus arenilitoris TaxID=2772299 RepID=A0A927CR71_9BACL|nr:extracellular solute-binding protein [Paenibacillus arenilitoris]MBD2870145.1 extracellular solute-binding protein [Paenibacillus arenilitoris]
MSPRKYAPLLIGVILLSALLLLQLSRNADPASTGSPDGKSADQPATGEAVIEERTEIRVNVSLPADQYRELKELSDNFMLKYPYIQVTLANEPDANKAYGAWTEDSRRGEAADVMLMDNGWVRAFAVRGYLQSADNAMTGDTLTDQMAGLLDPLKWNGYLWGVPMDVDPYVVVWNRLLLDEAGLKTPPADWPAYQTAAAKVIERHADASILNWSAGDLRQQLVWLAALQADPSDLINLQEPSDALVSQLRWLDTMNARISRIGTDSIAEISEALAGRKLLTAVLPWTAFEKLSASVRDGLIFDRERILFPWLNGRSYVVSSYCKAEEESMLWVSEMTEIYNQQRNYDLFGQLPARASLYAANDDERSGQSRIPPAWWKSALNANQPAGHIPAADPQWPENWQRREGMWRQYSESGLQLEAFVQALQGGA